MASVRSVKGMMSFTDLALVPSDPLAPFTGRLPLATAAYLARFKGSRASTPNPASAATLPGALSAAWTRWPPKDHTWTYPAVTENRRDTVEGLNRRIS